ncbi:hypothetical protein DFO66_103342 [Brevibacterium sanguinis]|uniref:Uncharacterized protein n=2 Tax=Brevibacterium TaxID=1696 RepID=A0A366IKT7_9MICO|nr:MULTISPECIES: hypothetical protein [Brevibacterium]RBP66395.1 hypothetical protein DFO66_103342 [Brevibacterium sanguinis]RBP73047.1 hypothetical protein DFO65_103342 [Brevibacterium celere]
MALKGKPNQARTGVLERWLDSLSDDDRAEAESYLRDEHHYGPVSLMKAFRQDGYNGSEGPIRRWREENRGVEG